MIDAVLIVRRSRRSAAVKWIARHCSPLLVCTPVDLESILVAQFSVLADAYLFAIEAVERGWTLNSDDAHIIGDAIDLHDELYWARKKMRQLCMDDRTSLRLYTLSRYEFETAKQCQIFMREFEALKLG